MLRKKQRLIKMADRGHRKTLPINHTFNFDKEEKENNNVKSFSLHIQVNIKVFPKKILWCHLK